MLRYAYIYGKCACLALNIQKAYCTDETFIRLRVRYRFRLFLVAQTKCKNNWKEQQNEKQILHISMFQILLCGCKTKCIYICVYVCKYKKKYAFEFGYSCVSVEIYRYLYIYTYHLEHVP